MFGAIVGDIIGSAQEKQALAQGRSTQGKDFEFFADYKGNKPRFTDDTVLTVAVAHSLMTGESFVDSFHKFVTLEPKRGYGGRFAQWCRSKSREPYNSYGNGSAMRVSPCAWMFDKEDAVLDAATRSAAVTHNHPEGIKGAKAVALAIYMANVGASKDEIKERIVMEYGYHLNRTLKEIIPFYSFDETCQGSVPEAIIAFLESESYEDAVRNAVALGGDTDTQACIAGSIAEAFYKGVPQPLIDRATEYLTPCIKDVAVSFHNEYVLPVL